ncbi:MAG: ribosome maturation factor RimM [Pseudomonadota bacterium]
MSENPGRVVLGRVVAHHGLKGWLKIQSFTEPREQIEQYTRLRFGDEGPKTFDVQASGGRVMIRPQGADSRESVEQLLGLDLWLPREDLPDAAEDEYYWVDLEGCLVVNEQGIELGCVARMLATGANDVMVLAGDRERLVPFVQPSVVTAVDLERKVITVVWEADW